MGQNDFVKVSIRRNPAGNITSALSENRSGNNRAAVSPNVLQGQTGTRIFKKNF
jgi:hypothetical protein